MIWRRLYSMAMILGAAVANDLEMSYWLIYTLAFIALYFHLTARRHT